MKAVTHLEVYRRFEGSLRGHPLRSWPILVAGIRIGLRQKLPLLILYAPPMIGTIFASTLIYLGFAAKGLESEMGGFAAIQRMIAGQAMQLLETRNQIIDFNRGISMFALLAVAWYGSGLLCEDRRVGAHQLYFARPLTRLDYFLGKFMTVAFFAALAMLVPGLIICLVASWTSPNWSFLEKEGDVVLRTIAYAAIWITVTSSLVLCSSSLFPRRSFALAGIFGFAMILEAVGHVLQELLGGYWVAISPLENLDVIASQVFDVTARSRIDPTTSWMILVGVVGAALLTIGWRVRRLEVVG